VPGCQQGDVGNQSGFTGFGYGEQLRNGKGRVIVGDGNGLSHVLVAHGL
jgi:hypothetical protein